MKVATTYHGVTYFSNYRDAKDVADRFPGARVVSYIRGWAVQAYISGPYYNILTGQFA